MRFVNTFVPKQGVKEKDKPYGGKKYTLPAQPCEAAEDSADKDPGESSFVEEIDPGEEHPGQVEGCREECGDLQPLHLLEVKAHYDGTDACEFPSYVETTDYEIHSQTEQEKFYQRGNSQGSIDAHSVKPRCVCDRKYLRIHISLVRCAAENIWVPER
jgi:hypothetical protein